MADAILPLRKTQYGIESVKGTLVAATKVLVGSGRLSEEQDFYRSPWPSGYRANVGGAGVVTRRGTMLEWETDLSAEQVLIPLLTGIKGGITATGEDGDKTWAFAPEITTGIQTVDTLTIEHIESDGSANHYASEAGYFLTQSFRIEWAAQEAAKLRWTMFGRARQDTTPTSALTALAGIEPLVGALSSHYLDTTWAGLGGTQLSGIVRSGSIEVTTGLGPDYKSDGRADRDFAKHRVGILSATQQLVLELDATGAARIANWRANDILFIRNKFTGSVIDNLARAVQVDGAWRFSGNPSFSEDEQNVLVTIDIESVLDPTSSKTLEFTAINALTAAG